MRSEKAGLAHRALVRKHWESVVINHLLSYPRRLETSVDNYLFNLRKSLAKPIVKPIECSAVVNVSGIQGNVKYISTFVASGQRGVSKTFLVFAFVKYSAPRIGGRLVHDLFFRPLIIVKWLFAMLLAVLIYLVKKLLTVHFSRFSNGFFYHFFIFAFALICVPSMNTASVDR